MNLLFWRKNTPAQPVLDLSDVEQAILDDEKQNPGSWRHRKAGDLYFRSDKGAVTILSDSRQGSPAVNCGAYRFSPEFSKRWFLLAQAAATAVQETERLVAVGRIEAELRKVFVE